MQRQILTAMIKLRAGY